MYQKIKTLDQLRHALANLKASKNLTADGNSSVIQATDIHLLSRYKVDLPNAEEMLMKAPPHEWLVLTGDNIDLAACHPDDVMRGRQMERELSVKHSHESVLFNRYIPGNHERTTTKNVIAVIKLPNGRCILCAHSDLETNPEKYSDYRKKKHGAGWLKRKLLVPLIDKFDDIKNAKIKEGLIKRAVALAHLHGCDGYLGGHVHPEEPLREWHNGVEIVIGPQGFNLFTFAKKLP